MDARPLIRRLFRVGGGLSLALLVVACATTQAVRSVETSGFLGDYSDLRTGEKGEAQLVFIDSDVDFSRYTTVLIDPVKIWPAKDSDLGKASHDELQALALHLQRALRDRLQETYGIAEGPNGSALRVRAAITEVRGSNVPLDMLSTVMPPARVLSGVKKLATGTQAFVGRAGIEAEVLDSLSGKRLMAAVDRRAGGKALRGSTSSWSDVEEAFDLWAERLRVRLAALRIQGRPGS